MESLRASLRVKGALLSAAAALIAFIAPGCGPAAPQKPSILVVVISSLRSDHVSAYGYARATTPTIDGLASEGALYATALTPTPWPPAAHASILSGRYVSEHGVTFANPRLGEGLDTVAEHMKEEGYATVAVVADSELSTQNGFGQGFDEFVEIRPEESGAPDDGAAAAEEETTKRLLTYAASGTPFFAYVVLKNPALPWNPPEEYRERFLERKVVIPELDRLSQLWIPFARQYTMGLVTMPPQELETMVSLYDGEIAYADYRLGRILDALEKDGHAENLAVFVTSDGGEDLGEHGLIADPSSLFDTIIRVPLVARWPGRIPPATRITEQAVTIDLPAAVLAIARRDPADTSPPELFRNRPVAICEAPYDPAAIRYFRSLRPEEDPSIFERNLLAVRTEQHKFVVTSLGTAALFDLAADPHERASVLEAQTDKAAELNAHLGSWAAGLRGAAPAASR